MKTQFKLGIFIIVVILAYGLPQTGNAQNASIKKRIKLKASYSRIHDPHEVESDRTNYFQLSGTYGISDWIEIGAYTGYSSIETISTIRSSESGFYPMESVSNPFYGINANFHMLPFFFFF